MPGLLLPCKRSWSGFLVDLLLVLVIHVVSPLARIDPSSLTRSGAYHFDVLVSSDDDTTDVALGIQKISFIGSPATKTQNRKLLAINMQLTLSTILLHSVAFRLCQIHMIGSARCSKPARSWKCPSYDSFSCKSTC